MPYRAPGGGRKSINRSIPRIGQFVVVIALSTLTCWNLLPPQSRPQAACQLLLQEMNRAPAVAEHAVLVPYRNRSYHLERFKQYMGPYLQRNFPSDRFSLWIIEQADDQLFNRGWLANVGLMEIARTHPNTQCVVFHDVDLIPEADGVPYNGCVFPIRLGSELEHFNWGVLYKNYFGGVVSMHLNDWRKINGFSNDFVGWGGEDDDLYHRVRINHLVDGAGTVYTPHKGKGRFKTISQAATHHPSRVQGTTEYAHSLEILQEMENGSDRWKRDGLSDVHYRILDYRVDRSLPGFISVHHVKCIP